MDYSDLNLTPQLNSVDSLVNKNTEQLKEYVDYKVEEIVRPGGINYYQTGVGRGYEAIVGMNPADGVFTELQPAINYVDKLGGGRILIKRGTYTISQPITIKTNGLQILGEDSETSVIYVSNGANLGSVIGISASNVVLSNFTINGNRTNQTGGTQFLIREESTNKLTLINLNLIHQYGTGGMAIWANGGTGLFVDNCFFGTIDGYMIKNNNSGNLGKYVNCDAKLVGAGFNIGLNNICQGCYIDTTQIGPSFTVGGASYRTRFIGCVSKDAFDYGFAINSGRTSVIGCKSNGAGSAGFMVKSAFNSITGCILDSNYGTQIALGTAASTNANNNVVSGNIVIAEVSGATDLITIESTSNVVSNNVIKGQVIPTGTYSGIKIFGTSVRNSIIGNRIIGESGTTNYLGYGIRETGTTVDYNVFLGNIISGAGTSLGTQGANGTAGFNIL